MKRLVMFFAGTLLCAFVFAKAAFGDDRKPMATHRFPAQAVKSVEVLTAGGSISVSGDAATEAVVEMFVSRGNWSDEEIREALLENYEIDIRLDGTTLRAVARRKKDAGGVMWRGVSISFKISVPQATSSVLKTSGGSIRIDGLTGSQDFKTSGGSLKVTHVAGKISGVTSGGSIMVSGCRDEIDLQTSGGSISAEECSGTITLKTSGGSIKLEELDGTIAVSTSGGSISADDVRGTLHAKTSGGSVKLEDIAGNVDAATSGGTMNVDMDAVDAYVRLDGNGNINVTLPAGKGYNLNVKGNKVNLPELVQFRGTMEDRRVEGTIGDGGPEIKISTSSTAKIMFD